MALIYYDLTIGNAYELVLSGLRESSKATTILELGHFITNKTDFPAGVCYKIIMEALAEGIKRKTIRQVGERYAAVPPNPVKLSRTVK
ncbi:uncharacterized protein LOC115621612 [Scaptodrosophila lebanonensis]|uniref:Uncharacterized protein LOC115621612 n=1 Tax=Drosophila lebanonensis TaxID=7225 RepID=A0A6J2T799_DROLE|nr:uncharacterized protein LOC115621612 [Scaptodrosophila lebanonensis]